MNKKEFKADVNSAGVENRTALHCATYENKPEALRLLLKFGASPDAKTIHYRTPLHIACILGEESICKILLDADASTNIQDFEKNTPVHYAAYYSNYWLIFTRRYKSVKTVIRERCRFDY